MFMAWLISSYQHDNVSGSWAEMPAICCLRTGAAHHNYHDYSSCSSGNHSSPSQSPLSLNIKTLLTLKILIGEVWKRNLHGISPIEQAKEA